MGTYLVKNELFEKKIDVWLKKVKLYTKSKIYREQKKSGKKNSISPKYTEHKKHNTQNIRYISKRKVETTEKIPNTKKYTVHKIQTIHTIWKNR